MVLLAMMITGCSSSVTHLADIDDDVNTYVLPKGMKFVSYDANYRNIIVRKARQGEEPEVFYVLSDVDGLCQRKFVER